MWIKRQRTTMIVEFAFFEQMSSIKTKALRRRNDVSADRT